MKNQDYVKLYSKDDLAKWAMVLSHTYPEISAALWNISDGMLHDDVLRVEKTGDITFTVLCHGEGVD